MTIRLLVLSLGVLTLCGPLQAQASEWAPPSPVEAQLRQAVADQWAADPAEVRLEWGRPRGEVEVPASAAVDLGGSGMQGYFTATFSAPGTPADGVRVRVRAGIERPAPVAARDLPRGTPLAATDIAYTELLEWGEPVREMEHVPAGWTTRRLVRSGDPLVPPAIAPPRWVERGDEVELVLERPEVTLRLRGIALGAAGQGEAVLVRVGTNRRLRGSVAGPGLVKLDG